MQDFVIAPSPVKAIQWFPGVTVEGDFEELSCGVGLCRWPKESILGDFVVKPGEWVVRFDGQPGLFKYSDKEFRKYFTTAGR